MRLWGPITFKLQVPCPVHCCHLRASPFLQTTQKKLGRYVPDGEMIETGTWVGGRIGSWMDEWMVMVMGMYG